MRIPAAGLAFIQLQTAPGPEAPFVHVMCLPTSPSCMQNFSIKEMRTLLMFPATLPFHFPVHDTAVQPHRLLSVAFLQARGDLVQERHGGQPQAARSISSQTPMWWMANGVYC